MGGQMTGNNAWLDRGVEPTLLFGAHADPRGSDTPALLINALKRPPCATFQRMLIGAMKTKVADIFFSASLHLNLSLKY